MELKQGMKLEPSRVHDGRGIRRIEITSHIGTDPKWVWVDSIRLDTNKTRRIRIAYKRLLSSAYRIIPILLIAILAACAGIETKDPVIKARCNEQPQWRTKDEKGQDLGIFICFGENSKLLYVVRVLPPAAPAPAPKPARKAPAPKSEKK